MYKIQTLNKISPIGLAVFNENYQIADAVDSPEAVLVRSAAMHDLELPASLKAIARAGAGVNNIPIEKCTAQGIAVFNTPGANANGVKELAIAGMLLAARDIVGGINWVQENKANPDIAKLVEKGKSQFAGTEISGKKLGVIGLGAIGGPLANAARHLGMEVYGCDPFISVEAAWNLSRDIHHVKTREEIYRECDYITIHVPLIVNDDPALGTRGMINQEALAMMKDGVVILNFARDLLVDDGAMEEALASGRVARYVTDFPNARTAGMKGVVAIPHLGASTEESEDNCAKMAASELMEYLELGNIKNSVNLPDVELPKSAANRIGVIHKNIPNMLAQISSVLSSQGINIDNMINKSKKETAYTLLEVISEVKESDIKRLQDIDGMIRVTVFPAK